MEREVQIPVRVRGPINTIEVEALLDSCYDSIAAYIFTDNCFTSTLADAMRSMDVSRVLRTRLSSIPAFCITCHRLVYSYVPVPVSRVHLPLRIWTVDSSPVT